MLTKKENHKNETKNHKKHNSSSSESENYPAKTPTQQIVKPYSAPQTTQPDKQHALHTDKKSSFKTRLTIKYDAGYPNQLYIRGKGANLNWEKGQLLKNVKPDEWIWETNAHFSHCEFKILINDHVYENGDNHILNVGSTIVYTPQFY